MLGKSCFIGFKQKKTYDNTFETKLVWNYSFLPIYVLYIIYFTFKSKNILTSYFGKIHLVHSKAFLFPFSHNGWVFTIELNTDRCGACLTEAGKWPCQYYPWAAGLHTVKFSCPFHRPTRLRSVSKYAFFRDPKDVPFEFRATISTSPVKFILQYSYSALAVGIWWLPPFTASEACRLITALSPSDDPFPWREPK